MTCERELILSLGHKAETLIEELKAAANFESFLNGEQDYYDWLWDNSKSIPEHIGTANGATRFVFWDNDEPSCVFKINMYRGGIDYGKQEVYIYNKAVERGVEEHFAWAAKVYSYGANDVYAMEYCSVDYDRTSDESWEYHARAICAEEDWDYDNLSDYEQEQLQCYVEDSEYAQTAGMLEFARSQMSWEEFYDFRGFINDMGLNDLHCGNWGYRNCDKLVLVDYAGYERDLMGRIA